MAQSVNSAHQIWRQFAGDAKAPTGMNLKGIGATTVQAPIQTGQSTGDALKTFVANLGEFGDTLTKQRKAEADPKVKAWMSQHTMEEYQQKMREGNVPFQNDPVAMDVLHNKAAYNLALQVEERVQADIKAGRYKTTEDAEKARIEALNSARGEYVLSMGISADSKAFNTGFDKDADQRRALLVNLQTDVTDKALRTQAKIQSQADMLAPLTPEFIKAAPPQVTSQYILNTIKNAETLGQVRNDTDKLELLQGAMDAIKGSPGGAETLRTLGEQEVDLYGTKASLRTHFGGGVFDQAVLKALETEQQQSSERQGALSATLMGLVNDGDMAGLRGLRKSLEAESGGKMTGNIQALDQAMDYVNRKTQAENAVRATALDKAKEKDARMFTGMQGLSQLITGEGLVSPDGKDLGFKDEAEAREGEERLLGAISDEALRLQTAMKMASVRPEGFAGNALKTWGNQAEAAWGQYQHKLDRGQMDVKVPTEVTRMMGLYEHNPEAFTMQFDKAPYIAALEAGKTIGASPEDVARSQVEWKKLPADVKKAAEDSINRQLGKITSKDPAYVDASLRNITGPLMTLGVPAETAVQLARESFDKQHTQVEGYPVHNGFFQVNGNKESYQQGIQSLNEMMPDIKKSIGDPRGSNMAIWYDHTGQQVQAYNLQTGERSAPVTRKDIQAHAAARAAKEQAKVQVNIDKAIADKVKDQKKRERGIFPGNQLQGTSGFSGAPK